MDVPAIATDPVESLTTAYRAIAEGSMKDLPICNDALEVEAVGFRRHESAWLGVTITPWFMNLTILPDDSEVLEDNYLGEEVCRIFPAGRVDFTMAELDGIGRLLTCSLFSPMFMFEEQDSARQAAEAALRALFEQLEEEVTSAKTASRRDLLRGRISGRQEGRP